MADERRAKLIRVNSGNAGTFGLLITNGGWWHTLECPDRDNLVNISRIPAGEYYVRRSFSKTFNKELYLVEDVEGRTGIRLHPANLAGDASMGYKSQLKGCIALGLSEGRVAGQPGVVNSEGAFAQFDALMGGEPFWLKIQEGL